MEREKPRDPLIMEKTIGSASIVVIGAGAIALNALEGNIGWLVVDSGLTVAAAGFLAKYLRKAIRPKIQNDPRSSNRANR